MLEILVNKHLFIVNGCLSIGHAIKFVLKAMALVEKGADIDARDN